MEGEDEETSFGGDFLAPLLFEDYEDWYMVDQSSLARPDDVVEVSMDGDSGPDAILDVALKRREILNMKDNLNSVTLKEEGHRVKADFYELLFKSEQAIWKTMLKERINGGLRKNEIVDHHLQEWEYYSFLMCLWSLHYYDKSPTMLFDEDQAPNFGFKQSLTLRRFLDILHSLGSPMSRSSFERSAVWVPPLEKLSLYTDSVDHLGEQLRKIVYLMDCTIISLDDDKLRHSIKDAADVGARLIFSRGHQKCPTFIAGMSKSMDDFLGGRIASNSSRDSNVEVTKQVLCSCAGSTSWDTINLGNVHISADRGILKKEFQEAVMAKGGLITGTHMPSTKLDYPFKLIKKGEKPNRPTRGEHEPLYTIHENKKSKAAFWTQSRTISLLCYRQDNGTIVNLATSDKRLGPNQWTFVSGSKKKRYVKLQMLNSECEKE